MDIAFNITRKCNKVCDYCYLNLNGEELEFNTIKNILNSTASETVTITGGEPLVHPQIKDILKLLESQKKHIHLLSNGILLNEDYLPIISESQAELFITYNQTSKLISKNLHFANKHQIVINLHHVLTKESINSLGEICQDIDFAKSIIFLYPTDVGKGITKMYNPDEWFNLLKKAIEIAKNNGIKPYFEQAFVRKTDHRKHQFCPAGADIFVDVDGKSYPCCLLVDRVKGNEVIKPVKLGINQCDFIKENLLLESSPFVRICPIIITDKFDGTHVFPSHLNQKI